MRRAAIFLFLSVLISGSFANTQEEELKVKGNIPFDLKEHLIIIEGKINGSKKPYNFVLDTGGLTFIDKKVVDELALKTRGNMAKMNTLEMGEVTIPDIFAFTTFNLDPFKKHGILLHGIIGSNLLERFKITIDYRNRKVVISPDDEATGALVKGFRCSFTNHRINSAPMIDCTINGNIPVKAMVDTGQPYSIAFPLEYLDRFNARSDPSLVKSKGVIIKWPNTKTTDSYLWRVNLYEQGELKIDNLMCYFAELPPFLSVPLLGRDYLSQFLITIDYPKDEIFFVPYEDTQFVENAFSFGLNLGTGESNAIVVEGLWTGSPADRAGIEVGDEIAACNAKPLTSEGIFELRQLLEEESTKEIRLLIKNNIGQREVFLKKANLLNPSSLNY